jgi:hypothetical protein
MRLDDSCRTHLFTAHHQFRVSNLTRPTPVMLFSLPPNKLELEEIALFQDPRADPLFATFIAYAACGEGVGDKVSCAR